MDPAQRVVITLPLEELFDSKGAVRGLRGERHLMHPLI